MNILDVIDELKITDEEIKGNYIFFRENIPMFFECNFYSKIDLEIFSTCLEIFKKIKINYYEDFKDMYRIAEMFNEILKHGESSYRYYYDNINLKEQVEQLLKYMMFFNYEEIYNLNMPDLKNWEELSKRFSNAINKNEILNARKKEEVDLAYKNKYFEFLNLPNDFNDNLEKSFEKAMSDFKDEKIMLSKDNDLLEFSKEFSLHKDRTYIICLCNGNQVVKIFRATSSFNFERFKDYEFEKAIFVRVEKLYAESLYIQFKMYFNMFLESYDVTVTSLKYTKLTAAKKAYKCKYGLSLIDLKKVIREKDLECYMRSDSYLLDKFELDNALNEYFRNKIK